MRAQGQPLEKDVELQGDRNSVSAKGLEIDPDPGRRSSSPVHGVALQVRAPESAVNAGGANELFFPDDHLHDGGNDREPAGLGAELHVHPQTLLGTNWPLFIYGTVPEQHVPFYPVAAADRQQ